MRIGRELLLPVEVDLGGGERRIGEIRRSPPATMLGLHPNGASVRYVVSPCLPR
jgi:hypothetical protein